MDLADKYGSDEESGRGEAAQETEGLAAKLEQPSSLKAAVRRKKTVPKEGKPAEGLDTLTELFSKYVEAVRDSQLNAQKQYIGAHRTYLEALQSSMRDARSEDVIRAYADAAAAAWARQDAEGYLESCRQYASALQEAQVLLHRSLRDGYEQLMGEIADTSQTASDALKSEYERFIRGLQGAIAATDTTTTDPATLARLGQTLVAAAWMSAASA
jgi:hypothetical protein